MAPIALKPVHNGGFSHLAMSKRQFFEVPLNFFLYGLIYVLTCFQIEAILAVAGRLKKTSF